MTCMSMTPLSYILSIDTRRYSVAPLPRVLDQTIIVDRPLLVVWWNHGSSLSPPFLASCKASDMQYRRIRKPSVTSALLAACLIVAAALVCATVPLSALLEAVMIFESRLDMHVTVHGDISAALSGIRLLLFRVPRANQHVLEFVIGEKSNATSQSQ